MAAWSDRRVLQRDQTGDWLAGAGDQDFLAGGGGIDQAREMGFRGVDVDDVHGGPQLD
jgi:hypothetical protein